MAYSGRVGNAFSESVPLIAAVRRSPRVVGLFVAGFTIIGLLISSQAGDWRAEASMVVQDPAATQIFGAGGLTQPARYVASQLAILESTGLALRVLDHVDETGMEVDEVLAAREVVALADTDLITVSFTHADRGITVQFANAFIDVYSEDRREAAAASYEASLVELSQTIRQVDEELAAIEFEIISVAAAGDTASEFTSRLEQSIQAYISEPNPTAEQLAAVVAQMEALQLAREVSAQQTELDLLLAERAEMIERRAQLVLRRDQLQIDSALALSGVQSSSPAVAAVPVSSGFQIMALSIVLGAIIGIAVAYARYLRDERFTDRSEPEQSLGVALLGEVPAFDVRDSDDLLPVLEHPASPAAEAFRFVAATFDARIARRRFGERAKAVAITSAYLGEGKTIVTANLAIASGLEGKSVLIVDGDFGDPTLSRLLLGDDDKSLALTPGITNLLNGESSLRNAVVPIKPRAGLHVDLLTRGNVNVSAPEFLRSPRTVELLEEFRKDYDILLLDCPPLLQVSYATPLIGLADLVVAVIPHGARVSAVRELVDRLHVVEADIVGYIYNQAPLRSEMAQAIGSMKNPLGTPVSSE
jgi:Mrp family chromosome partitioning ATPase